jgi:DNA repair protein RadC
VLDAKNHVIANILLYVGTVDHVSVDVFVVFRPAIVRRRPRILVAHNHPSLDPKPSSEDIELTRQLIEAGDLLGIELVDHLVIGGHPLRYSSIISLLSMQN